MSKASSRLKLWKAQGGLCFYCAKPTRFVLYPKGHVPRKMDATLDHVIPKSNGGAMSPTKNCVVACLKCNHERGTKDARIFLLEKMGLLS